MFQGIDLYSDTVTRPTRAMRLAMVEAEVGDEQKREDPTTCHLEDRMAKALGHSASMFFPSATMANEIAVRLHCAPGDELMAALRRLLVRVAVVDDLATTRRLVEELPEVVTVTRDGDVLGAHFASGGSSSVRNRFTPTIVRSPDATARWTRSASSEIRRCR